MEKIIIKRKEYELVESKEDGTSVISRKGKNYLLRKFNNSEEFFSFVTQAKKIKASGVNNPKVVVIDKKSYSFITEYVQGPTLLSILAKEDLSDQIYDELFRMYWYAKADKLALDYHTENWIINNGNLVYTPFTCSPFENNDVFIKNEVRQWFFTKEFVEYAKSKGIEVNENRLESEYAVNKKIALITLKFYR